MQNNKDETLISLSLSAGDQIQKIKKNFEYNDIQEDYAYGKIDGTYLSSKFFCHDNLESITVYTPPASVAIITGFGPTNSPTAGTLSIILKTIALQLETGWETEISISNLGAYLSRNISWDVLNNNTNRLIDFISELGFNFSLGRVRSHIDKDNLGISTFLTEHILRTDDFNANKEATEELYGELGLLGGRFGIITDSTYTVADILKPLFLRDFVSLPPYEKKHVIVLSGIEEHYFTRLATIALDRIKYKFPNKFVRQDSSISAIYARLIPGLNPYPKMSKSIPESAVNIGDSDKQIFDKIVNCSNDNDTVVIEMILQASTWQKEQLQVATTVYKERDKTPDKWGVIKKKYAEHFKKMSAIWRKACEKYP